MEHEFVHNGPRFCVEGLVLVLERPVPIKKVSEEKKQTFVEVIGEGSTTAQAAAVIGVCTRTITRWRQIDGRFRAAIDHIRNEARLRRIMAQLGQMKRRWEKLEEKYSEIFGRAES